MNAKDSKELGRDAAMFAAGAHAGRMYGEKKPYYFHLESTVGVLTRFLSADNLMSAPLTAAAWLHDTMEDTPVTYATLFFFFGERVANIVDAVTDRHGANRQERHLATYPMVRHIGGDDAVLVKLADRIANMEYSITTQDSQKTQMYRKEYNEFQRLIGRTNAALRIEIAMWAHLDTLMKEQS